MARRKSRAFFFIFDVINSSYLINNRLEHLKQKDTRREQSLAASELRGTTRSVFLFVVAQVFSSFFFRKKPRK